MDLTEENAQLKKTVKKLLVRLDENQRVRNHFHEFEFKLLSSKTLSDLLNLLINGALSHFKLDDVSLILVDTDFSLRGLIEHLDLEDFSTRLQLRQNDDFALSLYPGKYKVSLGELDTLTAARLFPNLRELKSAALMPMVRDDKLVGSLHFGSKLSERFSEDKATDFLEYLSSISAVCVESALSKEHLRYQSQIDMLTQVRNRMNFDGEFIRELERSHRGKDTLSCMFVDVDLFKAINDRYGHSVGDLCLKEIAAAIDKQLRKTDILARYGGEEFVILLPHCDESSGLEISERVRESVSNLKIDHAAAGNKVQPTVSIGLTTWNPVDDNHYDLEALGKKLLNIADEAMYEAKRAGRNKVVVKPFYQVVQ
jgi:diguanylate cyclase (GGDEF)-like protein